MKSVKKNPIGLMGHYQNEKTYELWKSQQEKREKKTKLKEIMN